MNVLSNHTQVFMVIMNNFNQRTLINLPLPPLAKGRGSHSVLFILKASLMIVSVDALLLV